MNNISFLLRTSAQLRLINPPETPLRSWRETPVISQSFAGHRPEGPPPLRYGLHPLPKTLAGELQAYLAWCTAPYAPGRPASIKKRPSTLVPLCKRLAHLAGFLVKVQGLPAEPLSLRDLTRPEWLEAYASWWISHRGKVTGTIINTLIYVHVIAQHWLKDEAATHKIRQLIKSIGASEPVRDKRARWLSLPELESIGLSRYPLNARRLQELRWQRIQATTWTRTALWVQHSLMLRFLIRIPFRQRNLREMRLGHNLLHLPNGTWQVRYRGEELKIGRRNGRENHLSYAFPKDLQGLLEEWLTQWRPRLLSGPDHKYVFLTIQGKPFTERGIHNSIVHTTWKFSGVAVNPHTIRDIWATEYIKNTRDIIGAAYMLGDKVETVLKHYAHLLDADAETRAVQWLASHLSGPTTSPPISG
jgi:hypothetical protein